MKITGLFFGWLILFNNVYAQNIDIEKSINKQLLNMYQIYPSNKSIPKLILDLDTKSNNPASFNNSDQIPTIIFNIKTYKLARTFDKDSSAFIAFILAHELYHYYHNENNDYKNSCWALALNSIEKLELHKAEEAKADYFAAQYSYMSGFDFFKQIPNYIDKVYEYFNIPDTIIGYPTKEERKKGILKSEFDYINFCKIYRLSNLLYIIQDYDGSILCNTALLNKNINNISIFNNIGVCYLQKALKLYTQKEEPNLYPIEFDSKNRFDYTDKRVITNFILNDSLKDLRKEFINQAISYFNKALAIDNKNETVLLNRAITNCIQGNYGSVFDYYQSNKENRKSQQVFKNYLLKVKDSVELKLLNNDKQMTSEVDYTKTATFHRNNIINNVGEGLEYPLKTIEKTLSIGDAKYYTNNSFEEFNSLKQIIRFKKDKIVYTKTNANSIELDELIDYYGTATDYYLVSMSSITFVVYPLYGTILYSKENNIYMILYKKTDI